MLASDCITKDGQPWFVAMDVCAALGTKTKDVRANLDSADIRTFALPMVSGRAALIISEAGLYTMVMKSRKPEAQKFREWVTSVVLPAIRKDGAYVQGEESGETYRSPCLGMKFGFTFQVFCW